MNLIVEAMPLHPTWPDILLRVLLSIGAGALVGVNRQRGGHAAGLRTTMLITLAACLAMIQANLLLASPGKAADSFASMDILRLPLGVLTGVGFIGGGAILRRGDGVTGVTTAAIIWIMTVIGLCFGGGQIWLGCAATGAAFVIIVPIKALDRWMSRELDARLTLRAPAGVEPFKIARAIADQGCEARLVRLARSGTGEAELTFALNWLASEPATLTRRLLGEIGATWEIIDLEIAAAPA